MDIETLDDALFDFFGLLLNYAHSFHPQDDIDERKHNLAKIYDELTKKAVDIRKNYKYTRLDVDLLTRKINENVATADGDRTREYDCAINEAVRLRRIYIK